MAVLAIRNELFLFLVAAELVAEGGEELVAEVGFAARAEAVVEGGAEHGGGDGFVDGGVDGPAAFAGVGDAAGEVAEVGAFEQGGGGEVEQPGGDDAAAAPDFGDVGEVEVVLVVFGIAEGVVSASTTRLVLPTLAWWRMLRPSA